MSTISYSKNPMIMASKFAVNFKEFESYIKYCSNILKKYNWLKINQYNKDVNDYDFMSVFFKYEGSNFMTLNYLYSRFFKEFVSKIDRERITTIKSNLFYVDVLSDFLKSVDKIRQTNLLTEKTPEQSALTEDSERRFQQCYYDVLNQDLTLDEAHNYSETEILQLIAENKILVLDIYVKPSEIKYSDLLKMSNNGEAQIINRDFSGGWIGSTSGDIATFFETRNEEEKYNWFLKNLLFMRYIRQQILSFNRDSTNLDTQYKLFKSFDLTYEHIQSICSEIIRYFKKRKKTVPDNYSRLIDYILQSIDDEKTFFDNDSSSIIEQNYEDIV